MNGSWCQAVSFAFPFCSGHKHAWVGFHVRSNREPLDFCRYHNFKSVRVFQPETCPDLSREPHSNTKGQLPPCFVALLLSISLLVDDCLFERDFLCNIKHDGFYLQLKGLNSDSFSFPPCSDLRVGLCVCFSFLSASSAGQGKESYTIYV